MNSVFAHSDLRLVCEVVSKMEIASMTETIPSLAIYAHLLLDYNRLKALVAMRASRQEVMSLAQYLYASLASQSEMEAFNAR